MSNNNKKEYISIKNMTQKLWSDLPTYQRLVNRNWLQKVHSSLKEGGLWFYPNKGLVLIKKGEGFILK
tara:strand:- start:364 stop:567 length:204 start_codon:yes stop_codon:yes gene_type:complete